MFQKLIAASMTGRDAIKTMVSAKNDFNYIKTNLKQYQDSIVDIIMYDLGDIVSDTVKKTVGVVEFVDIDDRTYSKCNVVGLKQFIRRELYHEIGHCIEQSDKVVHTACVEFLDNRTSGSLFRLADYYGDPRYDDEVAQFGGFFNVYTGKRVKYDLSTEVLSTGLEYFVTDEGIMKLYEYDREHFEFILNIIVGE